MAQFSDQGSGVDTWIRSTSADTNFSTGANGSVLQSGDFGTSQVNRFLIKWDLSSVPTNAVVSGGTLSLWVNAEFSDNTRVVELFRVKRAWVESEATWNKFSTAGGSWSTAGAGDTTNDREGTSVGSATVTSTQNPGDKIDIPLVAGALQDLVSGAFTNNGWLFKVQTEGGDNVVYKSSNDAGSATMRPQLVFDYTSASGGNMTTFSKMWGA